MILLPFDPKEKEFLEGKLSVEGDVSRRKIMEVASSFACDEMRSGGPVVAATPTPQEKKPHVFLVLPPRNKP